MKNVYLLICFLFSLSFQQLHAQCNLQVEIDREKDACANRNDGFVDLRLLNATYPVTVVNTTLRDTTITSSDSIRIGNLAGNIPHIVTFTDANNCEFVITLQVQDAPPLDVNINTSTVNCNGGSSGSISLVVRGGTGFYQFNWAHDSTLMGPFANGLSAGVYTVTVNDSDACSQVRNIAVVEPTPINIVTSSVDVSCFGSADGSIFAQVVGGTPPYVYLWPTGQMGQVAVGLPAGTYQLTVMDDNGCAEVITTDIQEPSPITTSMVVTGTCSGDCSGSVDLTVSGGVIPYTLSWSTGETAEDISGLCVGNPIVTITDANGCQLVTEAIIEQTTADSIEIIQDAGFNLTCVGSCQGRINVRGVCGTEPYTFDWSDDAFDGQDSLSGLCAGSYALTVTDSEGKTATETFEIIEQTGISLDRVTVNLIECNGGNDASINPFFIGGLRSYTYLWSTTEVTRQIRDLSAGTYTVTVTDRIGCEFVRSFDITEPDELVVDIDVLIDSCQAPTQLNGLAIGGFPQYNYLWSNPFGEINDLQSIDYVGDGVYSLTVTDANGCTAITDLIVTSKFELQLTSISSNCDSLGGSVTASVNTTISNPMYTWSNGMMGATISNLSPGGYGVTVVDEDGCRDNGSIVVELDSSCYVLIEGFVYPDNDMDCQPDNGLGIRDVLIQLSDGSSTFTNNDGYYAFRSLPGNYVINAEPDTNRYELTCGNSLTVDAIQSGQSYSDNHFYVKVKPRIDVAVKVRKPTPRPGFTNNVTICVMNYSDEPLTTTATFVYDSLQTYVGNNFPQFFVSHDPVTRTLVWEFPNHMVGRIYVIKVAMKTMVSAALGATVAYDFKVEPINGDQKPYNNTIYCTRIVRGSYDPNDKTPSPMGEGQIGLLPFGQEELGFLVRFQNTGTDTAFTVVIRDTLDRSIDLDQIVPGPSSHPYELSVLEGKVLEFTFNNILLPDSTTNLEGSNGFVFYDVYLSENLPIGTTINNSAAIYFDYNQPIITNTTVNTIAGPDLFSEITLQGCGSVAFDGTLYTSDASVVNVYNLPYYDSTVTTVIKVLDVYSVTIDTTLEDGNVFNGIEYTMDTVLVDVLTATNGCDSTITTNITVNTVGLNDLSKIVNVAIQPNPTSGFSLLVIESQENKAVELQVTNLQGQQIKTLSLDLFKNKTSTIPIDLSEFSSGVYLINLRSDQAVWSGKLIKL